MNLDQLISEGQKRVDNKALALIILGASGNGKSRMCGTFGQKTLYLHTATEQHGAESAMVGGKDILPICIDKTGDTVITPDEAYNRLLSILSSGAELKTKGIKLVALDGLSELETIIHNHTKFKERVQKEKGGVTSYSTDIQRDFFKPIFDKLNELRDKFGIGFVVTCALNVMAVDDDLSIQEAAAKLYGYAMAENITRWFPDILIIGQMRGPSGVVKPRIQLQALVSKSTKNQKTNQVKLHNIFPRVTGVDMSTLPETIAPDLKIIAEVKKLGHYPEQ
jgi:hypothetical protein